MEAEDYKPDFSDINITCVQFVQKCCTFNHERLVKQFTYDIESCDPVKFWCSRPKYELEADCDVLKIRIFWKLLFEKARDKFVRRRFMDNFEMDLKKLEDVEILEDLAELLKSVCHLPCFITGIMKIGGKKNDSNFDVKLALEWIKRTGNFEAISMTAALGESCWPHLEDFFVQCKLYIEKVGNERVSLIQDEENNKCPPCIKKSELLKTRGNKEFTNERFSTAVTWYTKAIERYPENHLLYGNRALCYLRLNQFPLALADGKRATILKQKWSKGHYRFCDALFAIGEHYRAIIANEKAQELCEKDIEGVKELIQQNTRFRKDLEDAQAPDFSSCYWKQRSDKTSGADPDSSSYLNKSRTMNEMKVPPPVSTESFKTMNSKNTATMSDEQNKKMHSEPPAGFSKRNSREESRSQSPPERSKKKNKESETLRKPEVLQVDLQEDLKSTSSRTSALVQLNGLPEILKTLVHNGHTALLDQCFHKAEQAFSELLEILDPADLKRLHLSTIDYVILIYGHANALLGIGKPEELTMAEQQFNKIIENYTNQRFNCLAFYGIGNVHLRHNRFAEARNQLTKSQIMLNRKIVPGVLTWPTTSVVIEETRPEKLQMLLEKCIDQCKFPPEPDATCRYLQCQGHIKKHIYFTDPDFEGFLRMFCCQLCKVEFHIDCWKKLKATSYFDKNDKDFLQETCFTPDCIGNICHIVIYSSTGLVKWQFEEKIAKVKGSRKSIAKQKCSSPRKLNLKQERKLNQKLARKEKLNSAEEIKEVEPKNENCSKEELLKEIPQIKLCIADPVLQHVMENAELIRTGVHNTSVLISNLFIWCVISKEDHTKYSASTASSSQDELMATLINDVAKTSNKVKTRVFLHVLNEHHEVDANLHVWLKEINNIGLIAADKFFSRYGDCLKKLDVGSLQKLWNETYGNRLSSPITGSKVEVITKYFRQASPEKVRCLIWLLEEHRQKFRSPVLHEALDIYFTIMDRPCVVLMKQDDQESSSNYIKVKNKSRKKKQKEPKPLLVLSGGIGTVAHEDDHILTDENSLTFLHSDEPFVVPENIREQVDEFESFYEDISSNTAYPALLNNQAYQTRESLYEYFFHILDKHGPLDMESELFVGQYELFPPEAQKLVEEAGGLKPFLLGSHRFFMIDCRKIGLMKHAVLRKEKGTTAQEGLGFEEYTSPPASPMCIDSTKNLLSDHWKLNPSAKEFKPLSTYVPAKDLKTVSSACENISTVNTAPTSKLTTEYESVPFIFGAGQQEHFSPTGVPFLSETNNYTSDLSFMASESDPACQSIFLDTSVSSIPDHVLETALDRDSATEIALPSQLKSQVDFDRPKSPHTTNGEDVFFDASNVVLPDTDSSSLSAVQRKKSGKKTCLTRMVAVQVVIEWSDHEVNTDPFQPFEKHQGDILQMEKEHHVLQEQLKDATEKYELSRSRNIEEMSLVEKQQLKIAEDNKVSKTELDWFYQDLENEVKKWQQERKEHQERIKGIKSQIKLLNENNEKCLRSIEEKEQQYSTLFDQFLESSNKFANDKMKLEENIKKGKDNILENSKRAVASEISFLENQKNVEIFKLCCDMSTGQYNLHFLHSVGSSVPPSALPHFKSQVMAWEAYVASIDQEIAIVVSQFDDRINLVRSGAKLSALQPVQVSTFLSPSSIPMPGMMPPVHDPAIIKCSSQLSQLPNTHLPTISTSSITVATQPAVNTCTGKQADAPTIVKSLNNASVERTSISVERSPSMHTSVSKSLQPGGTNSDITGSKPVSDNKAVTLSPSKAKNPYDQLIGHLNAIFPHYDGAELSHFVKETRIKNGNSFSGLDSSEVISRVIEFILDHQSKTSPPKETGHSSNALRDNAGCEQKEGHSWATITNSTKPWKSVKETSKSGWQTSKDSACFDDDPCIICHEELRQYTICVLECGHRFHKHCIKTWLNAQSTCPTCRVHVLLSEDFPVLTSRKRPTLK